MAEPGKAVNLPPKPFFYTLDQVAYLLSIEESTLKQSYLHYEGRSVGVAGRDYIIARNIAPSGMKPEWRIAERELIRWMRFKGWRYRERGYVEDQTNHKR